MADEKPGSPPNDGAGPGLPQDQGKPETGPRVHYTTEYRSKASGEVISSHDTKSPLDGEGGNLPSFELVQVYGVYEDDFRKGKGGSVHGAASYMIRICSAELRNALQSVVEYYPDQDLQGNKIEIAEPYPILAHHYEELAAFASKCEAAPQEKLCRRERDAPRHIRLLLGFLDERVMEGYRAEKERRKTGTSTFEWYWVGFKPGSLRLTALTGKTDRSRSASGDMEWQAAVVHSITGGSFTNPPTGWVIRWWRLAFGGRIYLDRVVDWDSYSRWDGEKDNEYALTFSDVRSMMEHPAVPQLIAAGKAYWALLQKQCRHYSGPSAVFPYNHVEGLVMSDIRTYLQDASLGHSILHGDLRKWITDCDCVVCQENKLEKSLDAKFGDFNRLDPEDEIDDSADEGVADIVRLLLPADIPAYNFRTRSWERLWVRNFSEPQFDERMIDHLVMDPKRLRILKALSKSFARVDSEGEQMQNSQQWAADFVKGKGTGLIFLLHGRPGVGKTCTAECISEFTRRPLMVLTSSDIGISPKDVEFNLTKHFKTAMSWGAVLLIDEADVFMERRSTQDLNRNSLVAGFLRALEFYRGILFLTTNRVGSFDDAFISRIHVQLYYPDFTDDQRQQVWKTFIDKLARERGGVMRLSIDAKDYIGGREMRELKWNGREIRNAFQTAVALAEFDAERDAEGRILVTDEHLRSVVELSRDFKNYLKELHRGDEGKRAERKYERLDN